MGSKKRDFYFKDARTENIYKPWCIILTFLAYKKTIILMYKDIIIIQRI